MKDVIRYAVPQNFPGQDGWVGRRMIDAFDPKFKQGVNASWDTIKPDPATIFYQADEGDYMYGFSTGHGDETGVTPHDSAWAPHSGFIALIGGLTWRGR